MPPASTGQIASLHFVRHYAARPPRRPITAIHRPKWRLVKKQEPTFEEWEQAREERQREAEEDTFRSKRDEHTETEQEQEPEPPEPIFNISAAARRRIYRLFYIAPPVTFFFMFLCPVEPMRVTGASMAPLLNVNSSPELPETSDWILVQRVLLDSIFRPRMSKWEIERDQVVVIYTPHAPEKLTVKRVVGIPGDRVRPLPGYPGGDDPVVVPYNHIWVEGDANSRDKSIDSNWYGPVSQNLVVGSAKILMTPWHSWKMIRAEQHDYPAKNSGRVEYDVVHDAKVNPDAKRHSEAFHDGTAARELAVIRKNRELLPTIMRDEKKFSKLRTMYAHAKWELEAQNLESQEVAQAIVEELETAFKAVGLSKDGSRLRPAASAGDSYSGNGDGNDIAWKKLNDDLKRNKNRERS